MSAVAALVALAATALIPRPPSRRSALVPVGAEA